MIQHALRTISRMPGLAAVVILSLGVGIGVNTTVFSWIQAVMLHPLPGVVDSANFYLIEPKADNGTYPGVSWPEYGDLRARVKAFPDLLAYRMAPMSVGEPGRTERAYGMLISGNYFSALGLKPASGRLVEPREAERAGGEPVVVISHDYWQNYFKGDPSIVGRSMRINDNQLDVIGIAPKGFQGTVLGLQFDLWIPATMAPVLIAGSTELDSRGQRGYAVLGHLGPGATEAQALTQVTSAVSELGRAYPETNGSMTAEMHPFWSAPRGPQRMLTQGLWLLQGLMLLVLLAVCGNTANLVLARASTRHKEIGVYLALGAGPFRIVRLILAENVLLSLGGAVLGIAIAWWGTEALRTMPPYGAFPVKFQTSLDGLGLAFAVGLGLLSGVVFGAAPAIQLGRVDPQSALRQGSKSAARSATRDGLMALQVGLALLVLVVAGLFFQSFVETRETDPGFKMEGLLLATYDLSGRVTPDEAGGRLMRDFADRLQDRLESVPGVEAVAIATNLPLDIHGLPSRSFALEGRARTQDAEDQALTITTTRGYFKAMGIPILSGSDFADIGDAAAPRQVVVNEEFVHRYVTGEVIGRKLTFRDRDYYVTGVVKNSTYDTFGEPATPAMYFSYKDRPASLGEIHLRATTGAETTFAAEIQRAVREIDATLPVFNVRTMAEHVDRNLFLRKIPARMFLIIAPLLLALVSIGIYAVVSYTVSQRTSEIGIRIALGATANRVVSQIVKEALIVISTGAFLAWVLAIMVDTHLFAGVWADMPIMLGVPVILLSVAALACWLPARRATTVDPMVALRAE